MAHERILIVEDELDILELYKYNLTKEGYTTFTATSGENALEQIKVTTPDLILLDLMLPGIDGMALCRLIKQETSSISVIMVTARGEEADIITGLELGADDYIVKPFSPKILMARIRSVLRRKKNHTLLEPGKVLTAFGIKLNTERFEVRVDEQLVEMSATEFALLKLLMESPGIVLSRSRIINSVKGDNYPVTERSVDVQILGVRKKLGAKGSCIRTVRGIGYRFKDQ